MSIKFISPKKSVNSAFLKLPVPVEKMENFKLSLKALYGKRDPKKDEEYHKNELQAFLKKIFDPAYLVQVKRPIDLAIYNGNDANAKPAVIIEMKSPTNLSEMFSEQHPNTKALQELVYYFLLEYVHFGNREIKHLVISNFDEYYFFDVKDFVRFFANSSKPIYKQFLMFVSKQTSGNKTSDFYNDIAKPAIDDFLKSCDISVVHFSLEDAVKAVEKNDDKKLVALYKMLSPEGLLAKPFANDSNSLDRNFYAELLHIIGLEEVKEDKGGKPYLLFPAYSSEKSGDTFVSTWVRFLYFPPKDAAVDVLQPEWMKPKGRFTATGSFEVSVYNDEFRFSSVVKEMEEYVYEGNG